MQLEMSLTMLCDLNYSGLDSKYFLEINKIYINLLNN